MPKPAKKPAPATAPSIPPARPGKRQSFGKGPTNPRLQADNRWQRTKRYGWDSR